MDSGGRRGFPASVPPLAVRLAIRTMKGSHDRAAQHSRSRRQGSAHYRRFLGHWRGAGARLCRAGGIGGVHYNSSAAAAEALCADIRAAGGKATAVHGDVTKPAEITRVVEETAMTFGRLDGLINNAGGMVNAYLTPPSTKPCSRR